MDLLSEAGDPNFRLNLRAFLVGGPDRSQLSQVKRIKPDKLQQGEEELLELSVVVEPVNPQVLAVGFTRKSFQVPFHTLILPNGVIQMGYVATVTAMDSKIRITESASALQLITVAGKDRVSANSESMGY